MFFNIQTLNAIVDDAKLKAPQLSAQIDKAADALIGNPYIHDMDGGLLIKSEISDNIYFAKSDGHICNCKAADFNRVCWHRLADRLVRLYNSKAGH